ncbi:MULTISPECIES: CoA transferase [unclassified Streptomyces]|uniref:CaiB/BaiF CoA-transferase family protein n=1 Tax=unclassified Streptomyces TaxID=2593676 RepID=UPI0036E24BD0
MSEHSGGALNGVRVIDFGQYVAGPLVAQLLADYGADVIRVDPPTGPLWKHEGNAILQRGKRSIVLDLKAPGDAETARRLVDSADVVIENFRPGVMDRLGLGSAESLKRNPGLIYCSIPGFASDDERAGLYADEGVVAAAAGLYPPQDGDWTEPPVVNTLPLASVSAALISANAIAAALIARERGGRGQRVEVSLYDAAFELTRTFIDRTPGREHRPLGTFGGSHAYPIARAYECADGRFVRVTWLEGRQVGDFARIIGTYDEWEARGFLDAGVQRVIADKEFVEALAGEIAAAFKTQTAEYWEREVGAIADLVMVRSKREWLLYDEQARAIGGTVDLVDPELGVTRQAGSPVMMTETPASPRPRRALDADRADILAELDSLPAKSAAPADAQAVELTSALEGIRAVDMTVLLAGPNTCRILAEYGAEVIHVGNPNFHGMNGFHYETHGGKRTVLLDLKKPGALDVFRAVAKDADVIATNFSQAVGQRLGVGEDAVRAFNPDVVYSRLSAHGVFGPRAEYRGHEELGQAATGVLMHFSKTLAGNMEFFLINDNGTGQIAAFGVMAALLHRLRTGTGQFVGSSLAQTSVAWMTPYMVDHRTRDWDSDPGGLDFRGYDPLNHVYEASDGRWLYLAVKPSTDLAALAVVAGLEGIDKVEADALQDELTARFSQKPAQTWVTEVNKAAPSIGAGLVTTLEEVAADEWALAHGLIQPREFPGAGSGTLVGPPPRLSRTPARIGFPVGPPGSDTRAVLKDFGFGDRVDDLLAQGTVKEPATENA